MAGQAAVNGQTLQPGDPGSGVCSQSLPGDRILD